MTDQSQRKLAEDAVLKRLVAWRGEDAIELVRDLNAIVAQTYFSKWRAANG